jgi:putative DNA primase/helicase
MRNLEAALSYAKNNWYVFPCHYVKNGRCSCGKPADARRHSVGKHPATFDGFKSATNDAKRIEKWWSDDESYNIGISAGPSRLAILDVDPKSGGGDSLSALLREHGQGFMDTVRCKTGSGGLHLYYRDNIGLKSSAGEIGNGLDIRAVDGYILGPGSSHVSGNRYEWVSGHDPSRQMLDVPRWLVDKINESRPQGGFAPPVPNVVTKGQRNSVLLSVAGSLHRRQVPRRAIIACLSAMNEDCFQPPVPLEDIEYVVTCVQRYSNSEPMPMPRTAVDLSWWWTTKW